MFRDRQIERHGRYRCFSWKEGICLPEIYEKQGNAAEWIMSGSKFAKKIDNDTLVTSIHTKDVVRVPSWRD